VTEEYVSSSRFCLSPAKSYRELVDASRYENPKRQDFLLDETEQEWFGKRLDTVVLTSSIV